MAIAPGQTLSRNLKIDTSRLETPSMLTVTLTVHASGALPGGFAISLDGTQVSGSGLTAIKTVDNAQAQVFNMPVSVTWTTSPGENLEQYRNLTISYVVTVAADQKAGG